jgi:hypothetical protein
MKVITGIPCYLLCLCIAAASGQAPDNAQKPKSQKFSALAHLPSGAGRRMVGAGGTANVDLYVKSYTSDEEAKALAGLLLDGGPNALLKALEKADSKGKITLSGRVGFYDLKLIRSHPTQDGRRIIAVGDRPMGFLELYVGNQSTDYEFGILTLDLKRKDNGKEEGEGSLIYAAKVKVLGGNQIDIESYGVQPIRLMGVRQR